MKKVGILYHPMIEKAHLLASELEQSLSSKGLTVWLCSAWESEKAKTLLNNTDLLLTTGGDGTILRAVEVAYSTKTPVTGINLGKLGFMTELSAGEVDQKLPALLNGEGWIDERSMLDAEFILPGRKSQKFCALNDVVVARGEIARLISVDINIDGEPMTTHRADGVIVATATGSTGYALAAGGPILHPSSEDFLLVPITPHLGLTYSMVLSSASTVRLCVNTLHSATLSIDGHINLPLTGGAVITVKRSANKARFLRIHPKNSFYSSLEQKLKRNK